MNRFIASIQILFSSALRVGALAVLLVLCAFPAFKGVWLGYLPLLVGGVLAVGLAFGQLRLEHLLGTMRESRVLLLLTLLPLSVQGFLILWFRSQPTFDGLFVYREAVAWAATGEMNPLTYYAPGQVWYYGWFFRLFGPSVMCAQWTQVPLAAALPVVGYRIARDGGMADGRARLAGLWIAVYPGMLTYVLVTPYYFYLYTLSMMVMMWAWVRMGHGPHSASAPLWGGIAAGWGALTKATLTVAPIQALFYLGVLCRGRMLRRYGMSWLLFVGVMLVVIAPWMWRNVSVFGQPVLICTSGPLVFFSANNPQSDGLYSALPDEADIRTPADMLAHMAWCNEEAKHFIRTQPGAFARLVGMKFLYTWGTETTFVELINRDGHPLGIWDPLLRMVVQIGWAALVFLWAWRSLLALWYRWPATTLEWLAGIVVLSKFLIYSVYEGGARHHLPAVPFVILAVLCLADIRPTAKPRPTGS